MDQRRPTFDATHSGKVANIIQAAQDKAVLLVQLVEYRLRFPEQDVAVLDGFFVHRALTMLCPQEASADDQRRSEHYRERWSISARSHRL